MAATLTAARPEKVVLITDVFQNISQVPVAVENHLDTSSETTDSLYSDVQHPSLVPYDYATEDYSDYFYDDFTNYTSSQYNDDYNELNQTVLSRRDEVWNDFNITTGQLNHSDLYIFDGHTKEFYILAVGCDLANIMIEWDDETKMKRRNKICF